MSNTAAPDRPVKARSRRREVSAPWELDRVRSALLSHTPPGCPLFHYRTRAVVVLQTVPNPLQQQTPHPTTKGQGGGGRQERPLVAARNTFCLCLHSFGHLGLLCVVFFTDPRPSPPLPSPPLVCLVSFQLSYFCHFAVCISGGYVLRW